MIEIKSTLRDAPIRALIAGRDGVGKSTFCAGAPGAVFIAAEDGLDFIDARAVAAPKSWGDIIVAVDALAVEDSCCSIVIDSIDWAEALCWAHVCRVGKVDSIEDFGYGKGYVAALNEWRILISALDRARARGKIALLIAHAEVRSLKNPTGDDYDTWVVKLHKAAAGLLREWVDVVAFAELDVAIVAQDKRQKAVSSGKRVLRTQPSAGYQTKSRPTMPARLPLDWRAFATAYAAGKPPSIDALRATLSAKLDELSDAGVEAGCGSFLMSRGDSLASLTEAIATVDEYLATKNAKKETT